MIIAFGVLQIGQVNRISHPFLVPINSGFKEFFFIIPHFRWIIIFYGSENIRLFSRFNASEKVSVVQELFCPGAGCRHHRSGDKNHL